MMSFSKIFLKLKSNLIVVQRIAESSHKIHIFKVNVFESFPYRNWKERIRDSSDSVKFYRRPELQTYRIYFYLRNILPNFF